MDARWWRATSPQPGASIWSDTARISSPEVSMWSSAASTRRRRLSSTATTSPTAATDSGRSCTWPVSPTPDCCRQMNAACSTMGAASRRSSTGRPGGQAMCPRRNLGARPEFEAKMRRYSPRVIAFLGKRAVTAMTGDSGIGWGRYAPGFAGTNAWVLPNPSGLNRAFALDDLVRAYTELRCALEQSGPRRLHPPPRVQPR